jgi:hypothetical protein
LERFLLVSIADKAFGGVINYEMFFSEGIDSGKPDQPYFFIMQQA